MSFLDISKFIFLCVFPGYFQIYFSMCLSWIFPNLFFYVSFLDISKFIFLCVFPGYFQIYLSMCLSWIFPNLSFYVSFLDISKFIFLCVFPGYFQIFFLCVIYSLLSLPQTPRDSLKYFEISIPRHIRFADLRKNKSNNGISLQNFTPEVVRDILKILWKRGEIAS